MDNDVVEELRKIVLESLQSEERNLNKAVDLAINFSTKNSIPSDKLLELSIYCGSEGAYELAYIFAKTASSLSTGPEKAAAHYNAGTASYFLNLPIEAEEQYKLALDSDPNNAITHSNYGLLLSDTDRLDEAKEQYKFSLESDPNDAITHSNYGNLLKQMDRFDKAEEQYKLALDSDPNNAITHSNYGNLLSDMGRREEAEEQYKLALDSDPNNASTHYNYGLLLYDMDRLDKAEEQYKLALDSDPNNASTHYNYGLLLYDMDRLDKAEEQYKIAIKLDPKHVNTHLNYGNLFYDMDRFDKAEEQYKIAIKLDPKHVKTHLNYGLLLSDTDRFDKAEEQYKIAIKLDPKHVNTHLNYGLLLSDTDRFDKAEEQYKIAIKLDSNKPNSHVAYSLFLLSKNLEGEAVNEMKMASNLFRENGDKVKEHLSFAWLYEGFANKYYNLKNYKKSGEYADKSGEEYIKAGKQAGESFKDTSLTKGYTLKGRAKIRKLEIKTPFYKDMIKRIWNKESYEIEKFTKIIDCIMDASQFYEKAAEASKKSPKYNQLCNACSISMSCLSEMLDYMLAVIKQKKTPELEDKLKNWDEKLALAKSAYNKNSKGELFIDSLSKLKECIQNLDKYKKQGTIDYRRAFVKCRNELSEIANNIEGPLQKIIEDSSKQMNICRLKIIPYSGTETGYIPQPNKLSQFFNWILDPKRIGIGIFGIIITVIVNHYNEYLFSLLKRTVAMLLSKI